MPTAIPDHPPLLPAGYADLDWPALCDLCAEGALRSPRRLHLLGRLRAFIDLLEGMGVNCEIWIDGSFLTTKPDPGDVDVVACISQAAWNNLGAYNKQFLTNLNVDKLGTKARYSCDFYLVDADNFHHVAYFRGLFGFSRQSDPKGIARLRL